MRVDPVLMLQDDPLQLCAVVSLSAEDLLQLLAMRRHHGALHLARLFLALCNNKNTCLMHRIDHLFKIDLS